MKALQAAHTSADGHTNALPITAVGHRANGRMRANSPRSAFTQLSQKPDLQESELSTLGRIIKCPCLPQPNQQSPDQCTIFKTN